MTSKLLRSTDGNIVEIFAKIVHQTDKAMLINDGDNDVWLPVSQIEDFDLDPDGEHVTVYIPEWLAHDKELI